MPVMKSDDLKLRDLRVFDTLLNELSLTRAAYALQTTQPAISKVLARLRAYFRDPLFIRVGTHMQPTSKALELQSAVRAVLQSAAAVHPGAQPFESKSSQREFRLLLTDVGMIHFLPMILQRQERTAPGVRLQVLEMDLRQLVPKLESGEADIALGAFPHVSHGLRRQRLYRNSYVCVARKSHPRLEQLRSGAGFMEEQHVVITPSPSGHAAHDLLARALAEQVPSEKIVLRVPSFVSIAMVAMRTNVIGTMPAQLAAAIADSLGLATFSPPFSVPGVEIAQYWHERYQHDPAHKWLRTLIASLFCDGDLRRKPRTDSQSRVSPG
jgi:DNA-binding transcriptional LysR family regulator